MTLLTSARRPWVIPTVLLALALLSAGAAPSTESQPEAQPDLAGWWHAQVTHNRQQTSVFLHLLEASDGKQAARLTLPAIGLREVGVGELHRDDEGIRIGSWALSYDRERQVLVGTLPSSLVPVYQIPLELRRSAPPPEPAEESWSYPEPSPAWTYQADGPVWAGLTYDAESGLLFVATDRGQVTALAGDTGREVWSMEVEGGVRAAPSVAGDHLYVSCEDGSLYKLAKATGRPLWQTRIGSGGEPRREPPDPASRWDFYGSSAAVAGDRLFVGRRDGSLYALDTETGRVQWSFHTGDLITGTPAVSGDRLFCGSFDGQVYALSASDGALLWQHDTEGAVTSDLVVAGERVLAGSRSYDLLALDVADGHPHWKLYYWFSWVESSPAVQDEVAYVGSSDTLKLFALRLGNGEPLWERGVPGWAWARPAVAAGNVYLGTVGSESYMAPRAGSFLAADRRTGEIRWLFPARPPAEAGIWGFAASPAAGPGQVYAADLTGRVFAFATAPGRAPTPPPAPASPPPPPPAPPPGHPGT